MYNKGFRPSIDVAIESFQSGSTLLKNAIETEKTDIPKAIQIYTQARSKFYITTCQNSATQQQIAKANEIIARCTQRISELEQFLAANPDYKPVQTEQQPSPSMQRKLSNSSIQRPSQNLSSQVLSSLPQGKNQQLQQSSTQNSQVVQNPPSSPTPQTSAQNIQSQIGQPIQNSIQYFKDACELLKNATLMDSDGFFDVARFLYSKAFSTFTTFLTSSSNQSSETQFSQFWLSQINRRMTSLSFYKTNKPDAPTYYFVRACECLKNDKKEEAIQFFRKSLISSNDTFCKPLIEQLISKHSNKQSSQTANNGENISISSSTPFDELINVINPEHINIVLSARVKKELTGTFVMPVKFPASNVGPIKRFVLLYGPSGMNLNKLAQFAAFASGMEYIIEVDFLRLIGCPVNPIDVLTRAFDKAKVLHPSYLLFRNIEAVLTNDENDQQSSLLCDTILSNLSAGLQNDIFVVCTSTMPWLISPKVFVKFEEKIYNDAPNYEDRGEIINKCDNIQINFTCTDENSSESNIHSSPANNLNHEIAGFTYNDIIRLICEASISAAVKESGKSREEILELLAAGDEAGTAKKIDVDDLENARGLVSATVTMDDLAGFDQFYAINKV
ncbi:hypothetical protein TRFO_09135 [Tritrichomonas foetus]|uniref:ATPase AAA-type core domain-containing protein n=1 Tax=Tritrichomonas foetus TaxID=1144522 RepID=A0A1J4JK87_9EUKA|nr:hypothetical protein TRFO_09135 [Tritrichomonas foetus]|eukprot:OHS97981.1 hypothetical protein TRFO_09135 [Tritrichomonas foetus]